MATIQERAIKKAMRKICKKCRNQDSCVYVKDESIEEKCFGTIAYDLGYKQAVEKACEWWYAKLNELFPEKLLGGVVDDSRKALDESLKTE